MSEDSHKFEELHHLEEELEHLSSSYKLIIS
jgi:hypothetical protein